MALTGNRGWERREERSRGTESRTETWREWKWDQGKEKMKQRNKMIRYGSWSNLMDQIIYDWTTSCTIVGQRDICLSVCRHYTSWDIVLMTDWYYIMFNQDGMSPISLAASQGHTFCFRDFVKAGADIEAKDVVSKRV